MTNNISQKPLLLPYITLLYLLFYLYSSLSSIFWKFSIFYGVFLTGIFIYVLIKSPALYLRNSITTKQHNSVCLWLMAFPLYCMPIGESFALIISTCAISILTLITQINQQFNPQIKEFNIKDFFSENITYIVLYGGISFMPLIAYDIYSIEQAHIAPTYHLFTLCFIVGLFSLNITSLYNHSPKIAGLIFTSLVWYFFKTIDNFSLSISCIVGIPFLLILMYRAIPIHTQFFTKKNEICKFCIGILLPIIQIVSFYIQEDATIPSNIIISQIVLGIVVSFFWHKQSFNKKWKFNAKYFMLSGIITLPIILSTVYTTFSINNINSIFYGIFNKFIVITIFLYIILSKTRNSFYVALAIFMINSSVDIAIEFSKGGLQNYLKWIPDVWNNNIIFTIKYTLFFYLVVNYRSIYNYFVDKNTNRTLNIYKRLLIALVHSSLLVLFTWLLGFCYYNCTIHDFTKTSNIIIIVFLNSIIFKPSYKQCVLVYIVTTLFLFNEMIVLQNDSDSFCNINYFKYYTLFYTIYVSILVFAAICYLLNCKGKISFKQLLQVPIAIYAIKMAIAIPLCFVSFSGITYLLTQTSSLCETLTIEKAMSIASSCGFACILWLGIASRKTSN